MNYKKITYPDLNNGTGCRVTIWFCGCNHHCEGCHNKELWDFNVGKEFTLETYKRLYNILLLDYIDGVTLSGGDPTQQEDIIDLCRKIKTDFPHKTIWLYTGYTFHKLQKESPNRHILSYVDVVVDGAFELENRDITLKFRGSSNQHIYRKHNNMWIVDI